MAYLSRDGDRIGLRVAHVVGRSPRCDLVLDDEFVSSRHAVLRWKGEDWTLRDLGSRNGTFLDGKRLPDGESRSLQAGQGIGFGDLEDPWTVENVEAPPIAAFPMDGGEPVHAAGGLLALPSDEAPELVVLRQSDGRWRIESESAGEKRARDRDRVEAGGREWRLHLTEPESEADRGPAPDLRLADTELRFRRSRGDEPVGACLVVRAEARELGAEAHHELLLRLAELREEDRANGIAEPERGWIPRDRLLQALQVDEERLGALVHAARRQLAGLDMANPGDIVERRWRSRTLRIGPVAIQASSLRPR